MKSCPALNCHITLLPEQSTIKYARVKVVAGYNGYTMQQAKSSSFTLNMQLIPSSQLHCIVDTAYFRKYFKTVGTQNSYRTHNVVMMMMINIKNSNTLSYISQVISDSPGQEGLKKQIIVSVLFLVFGLTA